MDLPQQLIPVDKLNRNKEYARYTFKPCHGAWAVYRRGTFVGVQQDGKFEAVTGYENLRPFVGEALKRQYDSAQQNRELVKYETLTMFGIPRYVTA
jgi:hypothetical protein